MNFFERIKRIFFKNNIKAISTGFNTENVLKAIKKEKNSEKSISILENYCSELSSAEIIQAIAYELYELS